MTLHQLNTRFSLTVCALIVLVYAILFQVVAHTGLIENFMSMNFHWWDFLLVAGFIIFRLLAYLMVPAVLMALAVYEIARRVCRRG